MKIRLGINQTGGVNRLIWILTVALISSIFIFTSESYGSYVLLILSAGIFLVYILKNDFLFTFKLERMHWHIIVFAFFCLISAVWGWNSSAAVSKAVTLFEILIAVSILYLAYQDVEDLWCLADAIKCSGFIVAVYSFYFYGMDTIRSVLDQTQRLENEYANVNTIALFCSICVIIAFYELLFRGFNLASIILCIPSIVLIAATASRTALFTTATGVVLVIMFRYASRNFFRMLIRMAVIAAVVGLVLWVMYYFGIFGSLMRRMQGVFAMITGRGSVDHSLSERNVFGQIGLRQFFKTPIFGIGIDSSGELLVLNGERYTYLHNNYIEMLCCGGIIGFIIYYSISLDCIRQLIHYQLKDSMSKLCMILLLVILVKDFGSVSYYSKITYIYFLLCFLEIRKLRRADMAEATGKKADNKSVKEVIYGKQKASF